jgi:hypothetical protein
MPIDPLADEWPYDDAEVLTEAPDDPVDGVLDDGSCAPPGDDRPGDDVVFDDGANWEDGWE